MEPRAIPFWHRTAWRMEVGTISLELFPATVGFTNNGTLDASSTGAVTAAKCEDIETNPNNPTQVVLANQNKVIYVFDFAALDVGTGSFNAGSSSYTVQYITPDEGQTSNPENIDWTFATTLGGTTYGNGLIFFNKDDVTGVI